jgi:hyperosmotically inducible protein
MDGSNRSSSGYAKDAYITAKVKAALARDKDVTARNIKVETDGQGVVTLSGQAKTQAEADKAVMDARSVEGVTSVTNNLQVR